MRLGLPSSASRCSCSPGSLRPGRPTPGSGSHPGQLAQTVNIEDTLRVCIPGAGDVSAGNDCMRAAPSLHTAQHKTRALNYEQYVAKGKERGGSRKRQRPRALTFAPLISHGDCPILPMGEHSAHAIASVQCDQRGRARGITGVSLALRLSNRLNV